MNKRFDKMKEENNCFKMQISKLLSSQQMRAEKFSEDRLQQENTIEQYKTENNSLNEALEKLT